MSFGGGDFFGGPLTLGQFGYMAEAEGQDDLVDTFDARFNAALNEIREEYSWAAGEDVDINDGINEILYRHDVDPDDLQAKHIRRINEIIE